MHQTLHLGGDITIRFPSDKKGATEQNTVTARADGVLNCEEYAITYGVYRVRLFVEEAYIENAGSIVHIVNSSIAINAYVPKVGRRRCKLTACV